MLGMKGPALLKEICTTRCFSWKSFRLRSYYVKNCKITKMMSARKVKKQKFLSLLQKSE